jgi:hypothetical protein
MNDFNPCFHPVPCVLGTKWNILMINRRILIHKALLPSAIKIILTKKDASNLLISRIRFYNRWYPIKGKDTMF